MEFILAIPYNTGIDFVNATYAIAKFLGLRYNRSSETLSVTACGMDAVYYVISCFVRAVQEDKETMIQLCEEWQCCEEDAITRLKEGLRHRVPRR